MYDVFKVVNWLRVKNNADMRLNPNVEELTQMKTMKLLYYIQAASLSITSHRMFNNNIVAWRYGPVVEEVHEKYRGHRGIVGEITESDLNDYSELQNDYEASSILNSIYDVYGYSSAYDLMRQTHSEKPWQETPQSEVISDKAIKDFYSGVFVSDEDKK
ncbi:MAG: Panacea domain-containing protein [Limosilactobacillus fermentum]|uniref:Panacea domain-containing protein n=1 Tax=Limosilactobacillus fermentum TaxID=1613 RepID=UPI00380E8D19